jgi:FtsP/CotA-like multicopper oxidase with cupredoxin domain
MDGVGGTHPDLIACPVRPTTYEFTVVEPMVGMYHAHAHGYKKVPNGMLGAFTVGQMELPLGQTISGVEIPDEIDMALEFPMILNDAGVIGYSLNGKSFPATEPYVLNEGDWMLTHYMNEGLQVHPMHLHGMRQLVVARDGDAARRSLLGRHLERGSRRAVHGAGPGDRARRHGCGTATCSPTPSGPTACSAWSRH